MSELHITTHDRNSRRPCYCVPLAFDSPSEKYLEARCPQVIQISWLKSDLPSSMPSQLRILKLLNTVCGEDGSVKQTGQRLPARVPKMLKILRSLTESRMSHSRASFAGSHGRWSRVYPERKLSRDSRLRSATTSNLYSQHRPREEPSLSIGACTYQPWPPVFHPIRGPARLTS